MLVSYHVHSRWSDGKEEIADFVSAASELGLDEIGFSDHYVLSPSGKLESWSMPLDQIGNYVEAVRSAMGKAGDGPVIRLGVEADYFPETADGLYDVLAIYPFDYVIGAVHRLDGFPIDDKAEDWEPLTQKERDDIVRRYWIRMREMAESRLFDIAAHLDLTKKFGVWPSIDLTEEITLALNAVARAGMSFEVNTSGWFKPCEEQYPSVQIIQACLEREIPVVISSDAHCPEHLGRSFDAAKGLLCDLGCTQLVAYSGRIRCSYGLPVDGR